MEKYYVNPIKEKKNICVSVPGSKSITNRALMLAAMSDGICELQGVLFSDDSRAFLDCLIKLGFQVKINEVEHKVTIKGENGNIPNPEAEINVRSAGTAARFITVLLAVSGGNYILNSSEQMKKRPMKELLQELVKLGIQIEFMEEKDHFPFEMSSPGIKDKEITIDTTVSSQYASGLLMASVINGMRIHLTGSRINGSYIKMTLCMMEQFGITYQTEENDECVTYAILPQKYGLLKYMIEPDVSAACYFYAMAVILRVKSSVNGIHLDSMQGDIKFINLLKRLGAKITDRNDGIEVDATKVTRIKGVEVDIADYSDQALTLAVISAFAISPTRIKNIGHIKNQESNRVMVIKNELEKMGCQVLVEESDGQTDIVIKPEKLHGAEIETYEDHRVAMSFAMAGLQIEGIIIDNPMCCRKTFENYFEILDSISK